MGKITYFNKLKRIEKLSKKEQEDLAFDLINAFALAKNPIDSALLIQDLLTASEIKSLSKRLRIAKLLLQELKDREIAEILHCSFGTIARVKFWLEQSGGGIRKVIKKLPKRKEKFRFQRMGSFGYGLPQIIIGAYLNNLEAKERQRIENFIEKMEDKKLLYKKIQEAIDEEFKEIAHEKRKRGFIAERFKSKLSGVKDK